MAEEFVILVDGDDNPIGTEEKVRCHLPDGKLHRAFTALLFDEDVRLVLTRRASEKMLWPGDWDGTFASHPREGETYVSSAERRMPEELGISCPLDYLHKFEYHVPYRDVGSENEVCGTLIGVIGRDARPRGIRGEIDEIRHVSAARLLEEIASDPGAYCPWMLIALYALPRSDADMLKRHANILESWMDDDMRKRLWEAIGFHLPEEKWRIIDEGL